MSDLAFRGLLTLVMCADPTPLVKNLDDAVKEFLDQEAKCRGFTDWIDAYHDFRPEVPA